MFDIARNNAIENSTTAKDWKQIKTKEHGGNMQFNNSTKSFNKENGNDKGKKNNFIERVESEQKKTRKILKEIKKRKSK